MVDTMIREKKAYKINAKVIDSSNHLLPHSHLLSKISFLHEHVTDHLIWLEACSSMFFVLFIVGVYKLLK